MAIEQFRMYLSLNEDKVEKWNRLGYKVDRDGFDMSVDNTQMYNEAFKLIQQFSAPDYDKNLTHNTISIRFLHLTNRHIGGRVVKLFPPCNVS